MKEPAEMTDQELLTAYGNAYYEQITAFHKARPNTGCREWGEKLALRIALEWELKRRLSK